MTTRLIKDMDSVNIGSIYQNGAWLSSGKMPNTGGLLIVQYAQKANMRESAIGV
jgi:hypothetical protein